MSNRLFYGLNIDDTLSSPAAGLTEGCLAKILSCSPFISARVAVGAGPHELAILHCMEAISRINLSSSLRTLMCESLPYARFI
jgi:hypothetical protein